MSFIACLTFSNASSLALKANADNGAEDVAAAARSSTRDARSRETLIAILDCMSVWTNAEAAFCWLKLVKVCASSEVKMSIVSLIACASSVRTFDRAAYSSSMFPQVFSRFARKFLSASKSEVVSARSSLSSASFFFVAASSSVISSTLFSPASISDSFESRRALKSLAASDSLSWAALRSEVICSSKVFIMPKISPDWLLYSGACKYATIRCAAEASSRDCTIRSTALRTSGAIPAR
mmetsp:Transcript_18163/g.43690  ORF Transcript_18163/g.43690 Transcript_18163/m.43690 type:complete len:238 (+) Transcript_18163:860-1573(+)